MDRKLCFAEYIGPVDDTPVENSEVDAEGIRQKIDALLALLNPKERLVIVRVFDLDGSGEVLRKDIAPMLGVTHQQVSNIEQGAIAKLREALIEMENAGEFEENLGFHANSFEEFALWWKIMSGKYTNYIEAEPQLRKHYFSDVTRGTRDVLVNEILATLDAQVRMVVLKTTAVDGEPSIYMTVLARQMGLKPRTVLAMRARGLHSIRSRIAENLERYRELVVFPKSPKI